LTEITLIIKNDVGLHARPAAIFVQKACQFESSINVTYDGKKVNAKSILGILSLGAGHGAVIRVEAEGPDSAQALEELRIMVDNDFQE